MLGIQMPYSPQQPCFEERSKSEFRPLRRPETAQFRQILTGYERRGKEPSLQMTHATQIGMHVEPEMTAEHPRTPQCEAGPAAGLLPTPALDASAAKTQKRGKGKARASAGDLEGGSVLVLDAAGGGATHESLVKSLAQLDSAAATTTLFDAYFAANASRSSSDKVSRACFFAASERLMALAKKLSGIDQSESSALTSAHCSAFCILLSQCSVEEDDTGPVAPAQSKSKRTASQGDLLSAATAILERLVAGIASEAVHCSTSDRSGKRRNKSGTAGASLGDALCIALSLLRGALHSSVSSDGDENLTRIERMAIDGLLCSGQPSLQRHAVALLVATFSRAGPEPRQGILDELFLLLDDERLDKGSAMSRTFGAGLHDTKNANPVRIHAFSAAFMGILQSIPAAGGQVLTPQLPPPADKPL